MEDECEQLEQLKKIVQKYYEKDFFKYTEKDFVLKHWFGELYSIINLKKITEEEKKVYGGNN